MPQKSGTQFLNTIEQKGPAFQAGFMLGVLVCVLGYMVSLGYAYVTRGGFGPVLATVLAIVTTLVLPTGIGLIILGFIVAALSDGRLSWAAAAAGPLLAAGVWGIIALAVAYVSGSLARLLFARHSRSP